MPSEGLQEKIRIRFHPIGSVPQIKPAVCKISRGQPFSSVVLFLQKCLKMEHVYCYVNNSFSPNPHQNVGGLWELFKVGDELIVGYCASVAFG